jgi:hypothetical protein
MYNDAYTFYRDSRGRDRRTATNPDAASISKYGVTRRQMVSIPTTDATFSQTYRDASIERSKDITPRASVGVDAIYTSTGARVDPWQVRAGDTLTIRNLPGGSGGTVDKIRTFRISRTRYDVERDELTLTPGLETPSLEFMVAANAARME